MPKPTYIDFDKAQESVSIESSRIIILRHTKRVNLEANEKLEITYLKRAVIGGLFLYQITAKKAPVTTTLEASTIKKKIKIKLKLTKPQRTRHKSITSSGCGGMQSIKYN
jgi:hypothetical protein